jgi:non-specific serine/threonine protein kinase
MIGSKILHYKIIEKLGEGGMGIVYLAEDTKLDRKVAIKFLPYHIAVNSDERKRFEIEAKAAAALNHPNIATIHAIEESKDQHFLVMEYIPGKHLKDHINSKPLPLKEAINIAIQIAEGLQAAHEKGITHRDVKSSNIMITKDVKVKIMDFGLAKVGKGIQLTKEQSTLGTTAYMSPEQAGGEEVDHRTDIWSFGVVLYEMLTGVLPFKGDYEQAVIYSILNENPKPVNAVQPGIPPQLQNIIDKCFQKNPADRFQHIKDLILDLKNAIVSETKSKSKSFEKEISGLKKPGNKIQIYYGIGIVLLLAIFGYFLFFPGNIKDTNTLSHAKKMIVVLPFENLGNAEDEYFADGLTGEITSKLSGLSALGVIARSSAMQYKNSKKDLNKIASELGVQYVLEGTVQWEQMADGKKRVRISPELIEVQSATQIWSKPYVADFASVFELQANISTTVAEALNLNFIKAEEKILKEKITENSEAYDLYLRARVFAEDITNEENTRIAEKMYLDAITLDENFAAAYAGLSTVQSNMYWEYTKRTEANLKNSEANALKALDINSDLPASHVAMGDYHYHGRLDYESALHEYNLALSLQPDNVDANNGIGFVLRRQGKMREAISYFKKTLKLDPRNYITVYSVGETFILLREYDKGIEFLNKTSNVVPDGRSPFQFKAMAILLKSGNIERSRKTILEAIENKIGVGYAPFKYHLFLCNMLEKDYEKALSSLQGIEDLNWQFYYKPVDLLKGFIFKFSTDESKAEQSFTSAIALLKNKIKVNPQDSRLYTALGLAYAGIGQKSNALKAGKKGVDLLPMEKEAWRGSYRLLDLAQIYVMVGEHILALKKIERLLSSPTDALGIWSLKLDPIWDPLRKLPEYKQLILKYAKQNN